MMTTDYESLGRYTAAWDTAQALMAPRHNAAGAISRIVDAGLLRRNDAARRVDLVKLQTEVAKLADVEMKFQAAVDEVNRLASIVGKPSMHISD